MRRPLGSIRHHVACLACVGLGGGTLALPSSAGAQPAKRDATGTWVLWRRPFGAELPTRTRIEASGDSLTLSTADGRRLSGRATLDRITMRGTATNGGAAIVLEARWQGDSLVGTNTVGDQIEAAWLVRERARASAAPTRQLYRPLAFPRLFTATIPPALRIWPGDTVRTETVSAGGVDSSGVRRALGGNPLTGPFYVEGALPGDVIKVRLLRVRPNSGTARSGAGLAWNAVSPDYIADSKLEEDSGSTWVIDRDAKVARLKTPSDALRRFTVPLRPMLGCVGLAPGSPGRAETRGSGIPGNFGGNMDYNRVVEGATLYLQVRQPGAFLFLGDGHAAQGDGELTGSGLETSMDVEFSVELIRETRIGFPRIEDATHIMSVGIGGSMDQAFQVATTGLAEWLEQAYKLTRSEAAMVMGTAVEFDIAEVVDGPYNVVARLAKSTLSGITIRP